MRRLYTPNLEAVLRETPKPHAPNLVALPPVGGIVMLLGTAKGNGLNFPKLWLQFPDGTDLRVTVAGAKSRTPGFLMLTDGRPYGESKYFGRISPAGVLELGRDGEAVRGDLLPLLEALAANPAKVASDYGHLTGACCFCSLRLTDARSVHVGYGERCAERFGLPWGDRSAN